MVQSILLPVFQLSDLLAREEAERQAAEARERAKVERRCPECNNKVGVMVMVMVMVMKKLYPRADWLLPHTQIKPVRTRMKPV